MKTTLNAIRYSLPIRLLAIQLRKYKLLLLFWAVLLRIISGKLGAGLGFPYLFLEPEYLGEEGFLSVLVIGSTLGAFIFAYMVTLYINESYRFPFIIRHKHPFIVFSINNFILPLTLLAVYLFQFTIFHLETQRGFNHIVADKLLGLISGIGLSFLMFSIYFFAIGRRSILRVPGETLEREIEAARGGKGKKLILKKAREVFRRVHRVDYYLANPIKIAKPPKGEIPFRQVIDILNRNHGNLLLLQLGVFVLILGLASMEASPVFNFPAGATHSTRLFTGASGGMIGAAYFRELAMRQALGDAVNVRGEQYKLNITRDMLNRVAFRLFTDGIVPNRRIEIDGLAYDYERGIAFDRQLQLNLPELAGRKLRHYSEVEAQGIIPSMILTPSILNQGVKLYISASPVAFLAGRKTIASDFPSKAHGVEFTRMFGRHGADSLSIASALRMNATFPFVLPVVELPSAPPMMVMDAGAIDNYGVQTAVGYLFTFRKWFAQHTKGVVFIQIRDNIRHDPIQDLSKSGFMARSFAPLGGGYSAIVEAKDTGNDLLLESVNTWYEGSFDMVSFEYPQETSDRPAAISLHLTEREKVSILRSVYTTHNERSFNKLRGMFLPNLAEQK
jgi:hypothetical protein